MCCFRDFCSGFEALLSAALVSFSPTLSSPRHGRHYKPLGFRDVCRRFLYNHRLCALFPSCFHFFPSVLLLRKGTHEYFKRLTLFSERLQKAEAINSRPGASSELVIIYFCEQYFRTIVELCSTRAQYKMTRWERRVCNCPTGHLWIAGVSPLSDLTPEEARFHNGLMVLRG